MGTFGLFRLLFFQGKMGIRWNGKNLAENTSLEEKMRRIRETESFRADFSFFMREQQFVEWQTVTCICFHWWLSRSVWLKDQWGTVVATPTTLSSRFMCCFCRFRAQRKFLTSPKFWPRWDPDITSGDRKNIKHSQCIALVAKSQIGSRKPWFDGYLSASVHRVRIPPIVYGLRTRPIRAWCRIWDRRFAI